MDKNSSDNFLEEGNFPRSQEISSILVESVVRAYALIMIDREKTHSPYKGFSRKDYLKYRRPHDPHPSVIEKALGSWTRVKDILPIDNPVSRKRDSVDKITLEKFYNILGNIAQVHNISRTDVTIAQFQDFVSGTDMDFSWKTYASRLGYDIRWKNLVQSACVDMYRKKKLG